LRKPLEERGSVALEMALAIPALMLIVLGLLQFGLWYHARQVALGAAQEGARVAAAEGGTAEAGEERALLVFQSGIGGLAGSSRVDASIDAESVSVSISATLNGLLPFPGLSEFRLDSTATSYREGFRPARAGR
jgi:hypothetical protein